MMRVTCGIDSVSALSGFAQKVTGRFEARQLKLTDEHGSVLLREISCNFVDRVHGIRRHTIQKVQERHEITPSYLKEQETRVFVQSRFEPAMN